MEEAEGAGKQGAAVGWVEKPMNEGLQVDAHDTALPSERESCWGDVHNRERASL